MSDTQHSSDDSLRRLFSQLPQPATGASFEEEVMQKIRTAALKKQMPKMWKLQSTLIAAVVAVAFAVATWMAMPAFWELQLFFEVTGQQFAQQCSAGLLWLCSVLSQKEVLYLVIEVIVVIAVTCLPSDEWVRFQNEA